MMWSHHIIGFSIHKRTNLITMVKGNWQRRAEIGEARKVAAKQKKHKKDDRANFKGMVSNLFTLMDKHQVTSGTLHVWTDVIPSDSPPVLDLYAEEEDSKQKRRIRSGSSNETPGKTRKPSDGGGKGKKAHPRSKEADPDKEEGANFTNHLCLKQFYKGRCDKLKQGGKKSAGCRHVHYARHHKTLGEILTKAQTKTLEDAEKALTAVTIDDKEEESGGMDMVYHFSINLLQAQADEENPPLGQALSQVLSNKSCSNASLVYVVYENELIFDRYQEGVVVPELGVVFRAGKSSRSTSVVSEASEEGDDFGHAESTPAAVLEYVLTFLPDTAVASMARVCRAWHTEIGRSSSYLWRHLLERRMWPHPVDFTTETPSDEIENCFKKHYQIVRDVNAVKAALSALLNPRRGAADEIEMVYQAFSTRRKVPIEPNACVAMDVWSPSAIIAAYSHDCTIRLFKAVEKGSAGGRACRELISVCVNPHRKTTRRKARLVAMGLDDDIIGCLLHVQEGAKDENFILSIISRDDYLEAAGGDTASSLGWSELEEGVLRVIDIGEAVVNYVVSADELDHRLLLLLDFLTDGGDMEDVKVLVSQSVVACGNGRFLIEATISIPDLDAENNDDGEQEEMIMLDRKLVIFSSTMGAIVWMGDSNPTHNAIPRGCDLMLSGVRHGVGGSRTACSVVAVSSSSPTILLSEIDPTGQVSEIRQIEAAEVARAEILSATHNEWELDTERRRSVALFQTDVVAVDVLFKDHGDDSRDHRSIISFYPRFLNDDDVISYHTKVFDHCNILYMERIRDEYVLLVCEELERRVTAADAIDEVDGQWFGETVRTLSLNAIILHVPTRQVIDRVRLPDDPSLHETMTSPLIVAFGGNTIGVGVWWKGVVMTGCDVRSVGDTIRNKLVEGEAASKINGKKKKKARLPTGGAKKDGFARGMSLSG